MCSMAQPARKKTKNTSSKLASRRDAIKTTSKPIVASQLASMIEEHMSDLGLSEEEKNLRVTRFGKRVDMATGHPARS